MIKISACVIVKNEEKNIPTWLSCVKKIADEIIIVDTGSSDNTKKIALCSGACVYDFSWCDDFAAARNFALKKAHGDWIIFLDADEIFPFDFSEKILDYIKEYNKNDKIDALFIKYINFDRDDNNRFINSYYQLRVFKNNSDLYYTGRIHEELKHRDGRDVSMAVLPQSIYIYHTGYSSRLIKKKLARNLALIKNEFKENGEQKEYYAYLGECYYGLKQYDKAVHYSQAFIDSGLKMTGAETTVYYCWLNSLYFSKHTKKDLFAATDKSIREFPDLPDFFFMKSYFLFEENSYNTAEIYLGKMFSRLNNKSRIISSIKARMFIAYGIAGSIAALKNEIPTAINYYYKSLAEHKYIRIFFDNLYLLLKNRPIRIQIKILNKFYVGNEKDLLFLVTALNDVDRGELYLYYYHKYQSFTGKTLPKNNLDSFCAGNYQKSAKGTAKELEPLYKKILLYILKNKKDLPNELQKYLPEKYQRIYLNVYQKLLLGKNR